jgi:hypothetical protein
MNQILKVNNIPPNLNIYRNMHHYALDKAKKEWEQIVGWLVKEQRIKPVSHIRQTYEFWFKDKREHDPDNYACCAKFINDGLVSAGVLPRDNFDHIKEFTVRQGGVSKQPYILVHMEELIA